MTRCAICGLVEASRGNYCERCLDREFDDVDPEDVEAAMEFYDRLVGARPKDPGVEGVAATPAPTERREK